MEIVYDEQTLQGYIHRATELARTPVLVDRFLETPSRSTSTRLCDGTEVYIGGVMEHIEEAGIHSGDSACALPPVTLGRSDIAAVRRPPRPSPHGIGVVGLLNVQYALKDDVLYVLEANPRQPHRAVRPKATAVRWRKPARESCWGEHRPAAEEGILAPRATARPGARRADRGQGGRPAVPAVPPRRRVGCRFAARPGDEVHR